MECWICGKEESNADVKINMERLIGAVQEAFDNEQAYRLCFVSKKWYEMDGSSNEIYDLCGILGIDCNKLYTLARLARKWEQKRKWQYCFPAQSNAKKILEWLTQPETNYGSENLSWIHHRINIKAEKAANKAA
jgi:hypothetical protein